MIYGRHRLLGHKRGDRVTKDNLLTFPLRVLQDGVCSGEHLAEVVRDGREAAQSDRGNRRAAPGRIRRWSRQGVRGEIVKTREGTFEELGYYMQCGAI